MEMSNAYDKYLEYQLGYCGDFYRTLWHAISRADDDNLARLAKGFPEEVEAYTTWMRIGTATFYARCSDRVLVEKMRAAY